MNLLSPLFLLFSLLAVPILILYMLKLRRREVQVSSNLLWEMLLRDRQANAPWQRVKRNLLLLLQLLILAALVLALARPAISAPEIAAGSLVVLLDGSASMNATDVLPSRFEAARSITRGLIDNLGNRAHMSLILVGRQPQVLASSQQDKSALRKAIDSAVPTQGSADWQAAFALAAGAAGNSHNDKSQQTSIVIISDGGLPKEGLPPLPVDVRYIPVGKSGDNLAIEALALRPAGESVELFVRVSNYGDISRSILLSIYRDGQLWKSQTLQVPGLSGSSTHSVSQSWSGLPDRPAVYEARLSNLDGSAKQVDTLDLDNRAFAAYQPAGNGRVLLVTKGNQFLEQMLAAIPGITPFRAIPDQNGQVSIPKDPFDVYVLDGSIPSDLPGGNLLIINPPPNSLFNVGGIFTDTNQAEISNSPLTRYLDWKNVHIQKARQVTLPSWATVLVKARGGPLVWAGETGGRRVAVIAFDLHDSDLPLQIAFPILMNNLLNYLSPGAAIDNQNGLRPGDSLAIHNLPDIHGEPISDIAVVSPSQKVYQLTPGENGAEFNQTGELGLYAVNFLSKSNQKAEYFSVNLFTPSESNVRPAGSIQVGRSTIPAASTSQPGQRETWPWVVLLALILLLLEWLVYQRQQNLQNTWTALIEKFRKSLVKQP